MCMSESTYTMLKTASFPQPIVWDEDGTKITARALIPLLEQIYNERSKFSGDLNPGWEERGMNKLCQLHHFDFCVPNSIEVRKISLGDVYNFFLSMKAWKAHGGDVVTKAKSTSRAEICSQCTENMPIVGCFGCSNVLPAVLKLVKDLSTPSDSDLKGCGICGCALKAKVHLPVDTMIASAGDPSLYPDDCWIKVELSDLD